LRSLPAMRRTFIAKMSERTPPTRRPARWRSRGRGCGPGSARRRHSGTSATTGTTRGTPSAAPGPDAQAQLANPGQPGADDDVGLASLDLLDVPGVEQQGFDAGPGDGAECSVGIRRDRFARPDHVLRSARRWNWNLQRLKAISPVAPLSILSCQRGAGVTFSRDRSGVDDPGLMAWPQSAG